MCSKGGEKSEKIWKRMIFSLEHFILCPSVIMEERRRLHFSFKFPFFVFCFLINRYCASFQSVRCLRFRLMYRLLIMFRCAIRTTATLPQQKKETSKTRRRSKLCLVLFGGGEWMTVESLGRWMKDKK